MLWTAATLTKQMIDVSHKNLLIVVPLVVLLVACASPARDNNQARNTGLPVTENPNAEYSVSENYNLDLIEYTVKSGDRLSDIAKEITGQSSTWREIAAFNSIDNPRNLQTGTVLAIPTELIAGFENSTNAVNTQNEQLITTPEAQSSSLAVRLNEPEESTVIVTPVTTNRDFELNPIDPNTPRPPRTYRGEGTQVKVIGSYYPKGIYTEPAAYSKLILRAAPGTLFVLDRQVNDWYKIETASGSGYIRVSDAAIVEKSE